MRFSGAFRSVSKIPFVVGALLLAACSDERSSFLDPGGPIAAAQRAHLLEVVAWTMIAILPVFILVPLMLWRYRYRNRSAKYTPDWDRSPLLEIVMWGVPFAIVAVLTTLLWKSTHALDPYKPIDGSGQPVNVQVIGLDWKWLFIYPDLGIATVNQFAFPEDSSIGLDITTDTVMQSFIVPALAGQIYAMPGMRTKLHLLADQPGRFLGENVQWSGLRFSEQKFDALAMTRADFDAWVAEVRSNGVALDARTYAELGTPSVGAEIHDKLGTTEMPAGVVWFNQVEPNLFTKVIGRYTDGRPVPPQNQPGAVGYQPQLTEGGSNQ
ncbi:MAG: cytochrome ubiquinol oxidase subunit II [Rhodobacteraceae bacterium]|nr:cytochrome ubiquinol oxidase subunit II [Paracoccaceae bacterium]